jgi:hypothetical protein
MVMQQLAATCAETINSVPWLKIFSAETLTDAVAQWK